MKIKLILIAAILLSATMLAQSKEQTKPTKAQQELIDKAKPIQDELTQLKSQVYDFDRLIEYYTKQKEETNKKIGEKTQALNELQKQFDALPKEEKK